MTSTGMTLPLWLLALVGLPSSPWQAGPGALDTRQSDAVAVAAAFTAAWSARDLDGIVALFSEDATVRQRGAEVSVESTDYGPSVFVRDAYGVSLDYLGDPPDRDGDDLRTVVWAVGRPQIRAWLRRLFVLGQSAEAVRYEAAGDTVRWVYRATAETYRQLPNVGPTEGTAELTVRAGQIVAFTTESDPATVRAREAAVAGARARVAARRPAATGASGVPGEPPVPWTIVVALALGGAVALALLRRLGRPRRR